MYTANTRVALQSRARTQSARILSPLQDIRPMVKATKASTIGARNKKKENRWQNTITKIKLNINKDGGPRKWTDFTWPNVIRSTKIWVLIEYYKQIDQLWNHNLVQSKPKCPVSSSVHSFTSFDSVHWTKYIFFLMYWRSSKNFHADFCPFPSLFASRTNAVRTLCIILFKLFGEIQKNLHTKQSRRE